jgi:hypothetical protein
VTHQDEESGAWQLVLKKKGERNNFKYRAKRHMDPVIIKDWHREFHLDRLMEGASIENIVAYSTFAKCFKEVLKELSVYVRKNKGASGDCDECQANTAALLQKHVTPWQKDHSRRRAQRHHRDVRFIRQNKKDKEKRGLWCNKCPSKVVQIGHGDQHGTIGVWGSAEMDGAAQWYTSVPTNGTTKGKHRIPTDTIELKCLVRVFHGYTIMVTLTAPWVLRASNPDFICTFVLNTFLALELLWGRLPRRWYEHFDAGDGNWTNTTLLFFCYLVEIDVFDEIIICRHYVGHTHELVDGENSHIRAFVIGLLAKVTGAVIGTPDQLLESFRRDGPKSIFNRNSKRCRSAEHLNYTWEWGAYFKGKTSTEDGRFMSGPKRKNYPHKHGETHEYRIRKESIDNNRRTVISWRTRQDLGRQSEGSLPRDYWGTVPTWPTGTPVWEEDVDFSGEPNLGGYKEGWEQGDDNGVVVSSEEEEEEDGWGEEGTRRGSAADPALRQGQEGEGARGGSSRPVPGSNPFRKAVTFVSSTDVFDNGSEWMEYFNPDWEATGTNCAKELEKWARDAPRDKETFLAQHRDCGVTFKMPKLWTDGGYRGSTCPVESTRDSREQHDSGGAEAEGNWRRGDWDRTLVTQTYHPARGAAPARNAATVSREERGSRVEVQRQADEAAEQRADEPVCVGSLVFVRTCTDEASRAFPQPLVLGLVKQVLSASSAGSSQSGSTDPADELVLQYCTSSGYDKSYMPAIMTDADVAAFNRGTEHEQDKLPLNSVWTATVSRGTVAIANVVTNKNKRGIGKSATAKFLNAFPDVFPGGRVTKKHKFTVDGHTTRLMLKSMPSAAYEHHSSTKKQASSSSAPQQAQRQQQQQQPQQRPQTQQQPQQQTQSRNKRRRTRS